MAYQVVEKESFGTDWHAVRYSANSLTRFETKEEADKIASDYLTEINCNNPLAKSEKLSQIEAFMVTPDGIYLGVLDGTPWYMTYPKDTRDKKHLQGDVVKDKSFYMLDGKTEVAVRILPGT